MRTLEETNAVQDQRRVHDSNMPRGKFLPRYVDKGPLTSASATTVHATCRCIRDDIRYMVRYVHANAHKTYTYTINYTDTSCTYRHQPYMCTYRHHTHVCTCTCIYTTIHATIMRAPKGEVRRPRDKYLLDFPSSRRMRGDRAQMPEHVYGVSA